MHFCLLFFLYRPRLVRLPRVHVIVENEQQCLASWVTCGLLHVTVALRVLAPGGRFGVVVVTSCVVGGSGSVPLKVVSPLL